MQRGTLAAPLAAAAALAAPLAGAAAAKGSNGAAAKEAEGFEAPAEEEENAGEEKYIPFFQKWQGQERCSVQGETEETI